MILRTNAATNLKNSKPNSNHLKEINQSSRLSLGELATNEVQTSVKFEATPSPVCGERVAEGEVLRRLHAVVEGRVRGQRPTKAQPWVV